MMQDVNGWDWVWMTAMMALFWGVLIGALIVFGVWIARSLTDRGSSPLEIAQQRYARGEITKEQFEEMKRGLRTGGA